MATNQLVREPLMKPLKGFQLKSDKNPDWCPGCGDFGIVNSIQQALAELQIPPWEVYYFTGVGCSGKANHYIQTYAAHTLHGRVLPFSLGAKMANPKLTVLAGGGDGDGYGIGAGHFVHAGRRNVDMTYIVFDNEVYGLTKGQASPTLERGAKPKSLPLPNINQNINPLTLALASGYTFIARSYAFDAKHLKKTIMEAINHPGMALVDVLQPCPTYNDLHTKEYWGGSFEKNGQEMPRVYYLDEKGYDGKVANPDSMEEVTRKRQEAYELMTTRGDQEPLGVFYQIELPTYDQLMKVNIPSLKDYAPIDVPFHDANNVATTDLSSAWDDLVV